MVTMMIGADKNDVNDAVDDTVDDAVDTLMDGNAVTSNDGIIVGDTVGVSESDVNVDDEPDGISDG